MLPLIDGHFPRCFDVEVTQRCNVGCAHCFLGSPGGGQMTRTTADDVLAYMGKCAVNRPSWQGTLLNLYGGEPFLNWEVAQYLSREAQRRLNASVTVFTNGASAGQERALWCVRNGVAVRRSTAGCPEAAELTRPGGYTGRWLAEGEAWKDFGSVHRLVIVPQTAHLIPASVHWLHEHGYHGPVDLAADEYVQWTSEQRAAYCDSLLSLASEFIQQLKRGQMLGIENFTNYGRVLFGQPGVTVFGCGAGWGTVGITWDGRVTLCHRFFREPAESPLSADGLRAIMSAARGNACAFGGRYEERYNDWKSGREDENCRNCRARPACQRGCLHVSWKTTGSFRESPEVRCRFTRLLVDIARHINNQVGPGWWDKPPTPCLPFRGE